MKKPVLVVMAAGMGSRYGGLKQIDPVGNHGQLIIDYSAYDARRAGFETIVFIIKRENEAEFRAAIGDRLSRIMDVRYAFQDLADLPEGFSLPEGRQKPWGTTHAVLAARKILDGPFAVLNSDDYYGPQAFQLIYDYLSQSENDKEYVMVSYLLGNTVTQFGSVTRGICEVNGDGFLTDIIERKGIEKTESGARVPVNSELVELPASTVVRMNFWGFPQAFLQEAEQMFPQFLRRSGASDPLTSEFLLPGTVGELVESGRVNVRVLKSCDPWYGVTYREDKPSVVEAIRRMTDEGLYPDALWA